MKGFFRLLFITLVISVIIKMCFWYSFDMEVAYFKIVLVLLTAKITVNLMMGDLLNEE